MRKKLIAAIDIGSRAVRMKIGEINKSGDFRELESFSKPLPLGHNTFLNKKIDFKTVDMLCDVLHNFKQVIDGYGIENYSVMATSAIREATNKNYIIDQITIRTGLKVEVIDNSEEQFITSKAIMRNLENFSNLANDGVLIVVIGGGSIQITSYKNEKLTSSNNLKLGALRIRELLEPIGQKSLMYKDVFNEYIELHLRKLEEIKENNYKHLVVVGGEIDIIREMVGKSDRLISKKDISRLYEKVRDMSVDELVRKYKIASSNASLLFPSLVLLKQFIDVVDGEEIIAPKGSMVDGIVRRIYEEMYSLASDEKIIEDIVTDAKVLARRYGCDERHYKYVEDVSYQLLKKLSKVHGLKREALLLRLSSILCDMGDMVSIVDNSEKSYKMINMSDIFGMSRENMEILALVSKYSGDLIPRDSNTDFSTVKRKNRVTVAKLIAIIKLAKALDMTRKQKINIKSIKLKDRMLVIKASSKVDTTLEEWDFSVKSKYLKEVFGIDTKLIVKKEF